MGVVRTIDANKFPKQGKLLNKVISIAGRVQGKVVRQDVEFPFVTIVDVNGRFIVARNDESFEKAFKSYPAQGDYLNKTTKVIYNFNSQNVFRGIIVRDDNASPWESVIYQVPPIDTIKGRFVLTSECQYSPIDA